MRQNIRSFIYATHALCTNCFHDGEPIFRFEKPISRCPRCNHQLKQNANAKKWKEKNRKLAKRKIYEHRYNISKRDKQREYMKKRYATDPVFREKMKAKRREYGKKNRLVEAEKLREWRHKKGISKKYIKTKRESLIS